MGFAVALTTLVGTGWVACEAVAAEAAPLDLLGTWYVVVHYRDSSAQPPEVQHWEDKVWTFEPRGSRLLWTEYPVVLFDDPRGRLETLPSGRTIRSSGAWQPSTRQLEEIKQGLSVNPQWARSKSLRGDPERGYQSGGAPNRESASVIGYSESWEIRDPAGEPVFRRSDEMSSGRSLALDGQTEYRSSLRDRGPDRLTGSFSRDRSQTGSFVMMRSGPIEFATQKGEQDQWK